MKKASPSGASLGRGRFSVFHYVLLAAVSLSILHSSSQGDPMAPKRWPGSAILGNGNICAVYSDDDRIDPKSTLSGIQHLYYRDYAADYIAATSFEVFDAAGHLLEERPADPISLGMENFYTTLSRWRLGDGIQAESRAFAHPNDAIILSFAVPGAAPGFFYRFRARLLRRRFTDQLIVLEKSATTADHALLSWSNGVTLAIGCHRGAGLPSLDDMGLKIEGALADDPIVVIVAAGATAQQALERLESIRGEKDPASHAASHWTVWQKDAVMPDFGDSTLLEAYRCNLYAARAANLNGQIPADITGQFTTNNMPQLYPRDALMCARVFLLTGLLEEARQVLAFWADPQIARKSPGEWYARYDAHGRAVDAGSGARYDEPEWDSNGYLIQLANDYHQKTGRWPVDPAVLFQLADFLADRNDHNGLLYEGGIVEWSGYLPATNMIAAAALRTASEIARDEGDSGRAARYDQMAEIIATSLGFMFEQERGTYADVRFAGRKAADNHSPAETFGEALYLWDTSANFGVLWGYPDHDEIRRSNAFYARNCTRQGGGMQYFDAPDAGLAGYGHDLFFFTTSAAAQYQAKYGDPARARDHIDWMLANANSYGLMPERIYLSGSGCSRASPLSWCCAEFAAALVEWQSKR